MSLGDTTLPPAVGTTVVEVQLLRKVATWMMEQLMELGGCDHPVGICCCEDYRLLEAVMDAAGIPRPVELTEPLDHDEPKV